MYHNCVSSISPSGILYGEAAGSGAWYTVDKANGTPTSLNFTRNQACNDLSEGSVRSVTAVAQPEPPSPCSSPSPAWASCEK